eukprot:988396-Rhodomonas_salina.4
MAGASIAYALFDVQYKRVWHVVCCIDTAYPGYDAWHSHTVCPSLCDVGYTNTASAIHHAMPSTDKSYGTRYVMSRSDKANALTTRLV